jgi:hypothetical protein
MDPVSGCKQLNEYIQLFNPDTGVNIAANLAYARCCIPGMRMVPSVQFKSGGKNDFWHGTGEDDS